MQAHVGRFGQFSSLTLLVMDPWEPSVYCVGTLFLSLLYSLLSFCHPVLLFTLTDLDFLSPLKICFPNMWDWDMEKAYNHTPTHNENDLGLDWPTFALFWEQCWWVNMKNRIEHVLSSPSVTMPWSWAQSEAKPVRMLTLWEGAAADWQGQSLGGVRICVLGLILFLPVCGLQVTVLVDWVLDNNNWLLPIYTFPIASGNFPPGGYFSLVLLVLKGKTNFPYKKKTNARYYSLSWWHFLNLIATFRQRGKTGWRLFPCMQLVKLTWKG